MHAKAIHRINMATKGYDEDDLIDYYDDDYEEEGDWEGTSYGRVYSTSMMILAFTVPYRQLPIYQRDERVDEDEVVAGG